MRTIYLSIIFSSFFLVNLFAQEVKEIDAKKDFQFTNPVPATTAGTPMVFESGHLGYINCGMAFQHSSRLNPHRNWENPDFNLATYVGLGNPHKWVGLGISFNLLGLSNTNGAKNNFGESSIDFQLSRAITKNIHVGLGVFNAIQVNPTPINTLRTYYIQAGGLIPLKDNNSKFFSSLYLNIGLGNGKFQSRESFLGLKNESVKVYGSAAIQVLPRGNLIVEWTGAELAIMTAIIPFRKLDFHFTTGFSDLNFTKKRWIVVASYSFVINRKKYSNTTGAKNIYTYLISPQ